MKKIFAICMVLLCMAPAYGQSWRNGNERISAMKTDEQYEGATFLYSFYVSYLCGFVDSDMTISRLLYKTYVKGRARNKQEKKDVDWDILVRAQDVGANAFNTVSVDYRRGWYYVSFYLMDSSSRTTVPVKLRHRFNNYRIVDVDLE